jgi:hypothetical protein
MSIYKQEEITCRRCAHSQSIEVVVSLDGANQPWARDAILNRSFHRFTCEKCATVNTADTEFLYNDYIGDKQYFYSVKRHKKGYEFKAAGDELNDVLGVMVPKTHGKDLYQPQKCQRRVVFGLDELREKLVAADAGLEDTQVEFAKLKILYEHPLLLSKARLRLRLESASCSQGAEYIARFDHCNERYRIKIPWNKVYTTPPNDGSVEEWPKALPAKMIQGSIFEDGYVNYERLSPQHAALARLRLYVDDIDAGKKPDFDRPPTLEATLQSLPSPEHLPNWAMVAIREVIAYTDAQQQGVDTASLFEAAFNFRPAREWGDNAIFGEAEDLFTLLRQLPAKHIQGNSRLDRIEISEEGSWYDADSDVIAIKSDKIESKKQLKDYLYHEVGHSVHSFYDEKENNKVTKWLEGDTVGFLYLGDYDGYRPPDDYDIDQWVEMMGGYATLEDEEKAQCRDVIKAILDPDLLDDDGNYVKSSPPLPDFVVEGHPFNDPDYGPRRAYDRSTGKWWLNAKNWHTSEYQGEEWAFAINYSYKHLMAIKVATIEKHLESLHYYPDDKDGAYGFYSPWEFFAEIYRVYYDPCFDSKLHDKVTLDWLHANLGEPEDSSLGS